MYTYSGQGYLVPICYDGNAEEGLGVDESDFLAAYKRVTGESCEGMEEIDNMMNVGDWNSPDNTSEATLDGKELYGERGYMIALDTSPETTEALGAVLGELDVNPDDFYGYVVVECYD